MYILVILRFIVMLNSKPTKQMLSRINCLLVPKWRSIAYELLEPEDATNIDSSTQSNEDKSLDMLFKWLETDSDASYSKLIDALQEFNLTYAAEKIKNQVLNLK